MAFWSTQRIEYEQERGIRLVEPFNPERVSQGAYELSLSHDVITTPPDPADNQTAEATGVLRIPSGQFGILYTREEVRIPSNVLAFISIKASVKFDGLVNISGFHVDPGFHGRLKFSVYNAGSQPIFLQIGQPAFLIWFSDLDQSTRDPYNGTHQNQGGITPHERQRMDKGVASPAALDDRLKLLERRWEILVFFAQYVGLPLAVALLAGVVLWLMSVGIPTTAKSSAGTGTTSAQQSASASPTGASSH